MSSVPVTVQVLDVNDNAPHIQIDSDIIVCDSTKAGQVGLSPPKSLYSISFTLFLLVTLLSLVYSRNDWKPSLAVLPPVCLSLIFFSSILFPSACFSRSKPFTSPQTLYPLSVFNSCHLINTYRHLYTHTYWHHQAGIYLWLCRLPKPMETINNSVYPVFRSR